MNEQKEPSAFLNADAVTPGTVKAGRRRFLIGTTLLCGALITGATYWSRRWKYIVIHHSAGSYGSIEFLQQVHKNRQPNDPINAIPYHYVIGNGHGLGLGEVASDRRQQLDLWGTHVSARNWDRNLRGIGICLIGNFEVEHVPDEQYGALVTLTRKLMKTYGIPSINVSGHGQVPGESTKCPGKNFPYEKLLSDIA